MRSLYLSVALLTVSHTLSSALLIAPPIASSVHDDSNRPFLSNQFSQSLGKQFVPMTNKQILFNLFIILLGFLVVAW
jgi:hypothetical protein